MRYHLEPHQRLLLSMQHGIISKTPVSFWRKRVSEQFHHATLSSKVTRYSTKTESGIYHEWAREQGVQFDKVEQKDFGDMRGMVALSDIQGGEIFINLPRSAALVVDPLEKCPCSDFVEPGYYKMCPWYVKMAILLLFEQSKGSSSRIYGYIEQLPESIDTPVRWNEKELDELQNPGFKRSIMKQKEDWSKLYQEFQKNSKGTIKTYEEFLWALENVRSRSFSGPYAGSPIKDRVTMALLLAAGGAGYAAFSHIPLESLLNAGISVACFNLLYDLVLSSRLKWYAMCPIIDSLNHSGVVNSVIEYEYFKDTFVVSTDTAYTKGSQIFISYGEKTNEQLLQYYGFILDDNPHDACNLGANIGGNDVVLSIKSNGQLSKETMTRLEADTSIRSNLSGKFSDAVNDALIDTIQRELQQKKSSLSDDQRLLNSKGMIKSQRLATAIKFRLSQKELLEKGLRLAEKRKRK